MVRIESFQEGADGVAKAKTPGGSLFRLRVRYLEAALDRLGAPGSDGGFAAGRELPDGALELAAEAFDAECRAAALLARAEQTARGLALKLCKKGLSEAAVGMALGLLGEKGLQSDLRFAQSWIRQRLRHRPEGPRSLMSALMSRGVAREALREALASALSGDERVQAASAAYRLLARRERTPRAVEEAFLDLGWKRSDLQAVLDDPGLNG